MKQKGFSLVELLVVVAIIGVLAGVGIVGYDRYVENTRLKLAEQMYNQVIRTIETEVIIATNNLGSTVKERDNNGNWIRREQDGTYSTVASAAQATGLSYHTMPPIFKLFSFKSLGHFKNMFLSFTIFVKTYPDISGNNPVGRFTSSSKILNEQANA